MTPYHIHVLPLLNRSFSKIYVRIYARCFVQCYRQYYTIKVLILWSLQRRFLRSCVCVCVCIHIYTHTQYIYVHSITYTYEGVHIFDVHRAVHCNIISIVKPTRSTSVSILFYFGNDTLHVSVCCLVASKQTAVSLWQMPVAVCTHSLELRMTDGKTVRNM